MNSSHFLFLADSFRGLFLPVDSTASIFLTRVSSVALSCSSTVSLTFLISSVRKVCIMALSSLRASDSSVWSGRRRKMVRKCSISDTDSWNTVLRDRLFLFLFLGWVGVVSKLVFYAQWTGTVISGQGGGGMRFIVQELCESRGGRPGLSVLTSLLVSVDVKIYCTVLRHWSQLVPNMSHDIWGH